jgi:hypothetical protein
MIGVQQTTRELADMNAEAVLQDLKSLPQDEQEEVADFIAFLKERQSPGRRVVGRPAGAVPTAFPGMWSDRTDMVDSTSWVRGGRLTEWSGRRG